MRQEHYVAKYSVVWRPQRTRRHGHWPNLHRHCVGRELRPRGSDVSDRRARRGRCFALASTRTRTLRSVLLTALASETMMAPKCSAQCRDRVKPFLEWLRSNDVSMHSVCMVARDEAQANVVVHSTSAIAEEDTICTIPKSAILSTKTSSISDIIEREMLGGGLGLVFAVMHEQALQSASKWCDCATTTPLDKLPSKDFAAELLHSSVRA